MEEKKCQMEVLIDSECRKATTGSIPRSSSWPSTKLVVDKWMDQAVYSTRKQVEKNGSTNYDNMSFV